MSQKEARKRVRFASDQTENDVDSSSMGPVTSSTASTDNGSTQPQPPEGAAVEPSRQIVPYIPRDAQPREHPLFSLLSKERHTPQILRASSVPRHVLVSDAPTGPNSSPPPPLPGQPGGLVESQLQLGPVLPRVRFPLKHSSALPVSRGPHTFILSISRFDR